MGNEKETENKERIEKGRIFLKTYIPPTKHEQAIYTINEKIGRCKNTLARRKKNGGTPEQIKQAEKDLSNAEVEKDIEACNVAIKYEDISAEHKLSLTEYLAHLQTLLVSVEGK